MKLVRFLISLIAFYCISNLYASDSQAIGAQRTKQPTYLRISLQGTYSKPVYFYIFADHYQAPWYTHHTISKAGFQNGQFPGQLTDYFTNGEVSPWCDISSTLYEVTGARLMLNAAYSPTENAEALTAIFEFATAPEENSIVKTIVRESIPPYMHIIVPPDFSTPENIAKCKTDNEIAKETGQIADQMIWPQIGKNPESFPFLIFSHLNTNTTDTKIIERELITLSKFGFNGYFGPDKSNFNLYENYGIKKHAIGGNLWGLRDGNNYLLPRLTDMRNQAKQDAYNFRRNGGIINNISYALLMDEPSAPTPEDLYRNNISISQFRIWLQQQGKTLSDLFPNSSGTMSWSMVRPVLESERDTYPVLFYYTQKFRSYSIGSFMQAQKEVLHEAYESNFPVVSNFSDGPAIYWGNLYKDHGIDYFELMETSTQNAIWSEDWANFATTYQLGAYNIDLLRAATRKSNAHIGHYLISYTSTRKPWDIKLKAIGSIARGVKTLTSFYYGPSWSNHEPNPLYSWPERWFAHAELTREIGAAEDLLINAKTPKSEVALLYSSSSDIWTLNKNHLFGFERMHNWLALTHEQVPVDVLSERDIEEGLLNGYKLCYLTGPNITEKAAIALKEWVNNGGVLVLTAGAAVKNEYNMQINIIESILPANRMNLEELEMLVGQGQGRNINRLSSKDKIKVGQVSFDLFGVRQKMTVKAGTTILGTFSDNSPAIIKGNIGNGAIYCFGFLPSLSYIKDALAHRIAIENSISNPPIPAPDIIVSDQELIGRSYNPWKYSNDIRSVILQPFLDTRIEKKLNCNVHLVDAKILEAINGLVIPLSNYTLQPISNLVLNIKVDSTPTRIESIHNGELNFIENNSIVEISMPLQETDIIKIYYGNETNISNKFINGTFLSPNPVIDSFKVNFDGKLEIFSSNGSKVAEYPHYKQGEQIDVSSFSKGIYIIKITNNKMVKINRMIKI